MNTLSFTQKKQRKNNKYVKIDHKLLKKIKTDSALRNKVLKSYHPLILYMAKKKLNQCIPMIKLTRPEIYYEEIIKISDLFISGYIGAVDCLMRTYNPDRGAFSSISIFWMSAYMDRDIKKLIYQVGIPTKVSKGINDYNMAYNWLKQNNGHAPNRDEVFDWLEFASNNDKQLAGNIKRRVRNARPNRELIQWATQAQISMSYGSSQEDSRENEDSSLYNLESKLEQFDSETVAKDRCKAVAYKKIIKTGMRALSEREKMILLWRCQGYTLGEIGQFFSLSRERIRQIEKEAKQKFKNAIKNRRVK